MGEPVGERIEEIAGGGGESLLRSLRGGVDAETIGERKLLDLGDELRNAAGSIGDEGTKIAGDGRESDPEEEEEREADSGDEKNDSDAAAGAPAPDVDLLIALDDGHENDGEERADVEDFQLFQQVPGECESKDDGEEEEDVAVDLSALFRGLRDGNDRFG